MSTNDFLRLREAIERRLQEYGNFIVPGLGVADRVAGQLRWIEEAEAREARFRAIVEEGQRKGERTRAMLLDIGWPPPWHLPARMLDEVVDSYHAGSLSREEVVETVLESYDHGTIEELMREWVSLDWLTARMPAIQEGIDSFLDGRYFAAVCTLLPHVEGVLGEELRRKPNPQNDAGKFFSDTPLSETAKEFYIKVARADFWFDPSRPVPEMSRNAILHGRDVAYGTKGHALRTILVLDAVIGAVDEHRKDREETKRWAEWRKEHGFEEMGE